MAPKGENIIDWSDEMEFAFINIMLEKLRREHTTTWKQTTWNEITVEMVNLFPDQQLGLQKKNRAYKAFRSKGCNHYDLQKQLFSSLVATGALRISSTDPPPTVSTPFRSTGSKATKSSLCHPV
ncbi:hypothetical protein CRG98_009362 [Punica granatum]|uniref:Myb/SANT-like domain-containing protein n=1 Tax=Punica granatum TaxID=22663 RepID=A0A2I0KPG8_PUNGR|nr:hypothetical protein CRG98_009362 [Punica granatum]